VGTTNELPGYTVKRSLGVVQGLTVRTRNVVASIGAGFKSIAGGEIKTYTTMCERARAEAFERLLAQASEVGADGVIGFRYETNEISDGVTEVLAFGTAVSSVAGDASTEAPANQVTRQMVTTSNCIPNLPDHHPHGIVQGLTVRSSNFIKNIGAGFKTLVGGEVRTWTNMCHEVREEAFERMIEEANKIGAKGIIGMRYDSNQMQKTMVEVVAYGTAIFDRPAAGATSTGGSGSIPAHLISTDIDIPGHAAQQSLGIARGISVRSTNLVRSLGAGLKSIVGGEIRNYTTLCEDSRRQAAERLLQHAAEMGATAVVGMRYQSNDLQPGVVEIVAYGTCILDASRPAVASQGGDAPVNHQFVTTVNDVACMPMPREIGVVRGITVRSRNVVRNVGAGLKAGFIGGEISTWTELCETTRLEAYERLLAEAAAVNATGIVGVRYETNELSPGITEVLAYGTAVA